MNTNYKKDISNSSVDINKDVQIFKLSLFKKHIPYVYIKLSNISNKYRISTNYKFLNTKYNLKINYIRKLDKINDNLLFDIVEYSKIKLSNNMILVNTMKISEDNYINVYSYLDDKYNTVVYIFERIYKDDINISVLFVSEFFYDINTYLNEYSEYNKLIS